MMVLQLIATLGCNGVELVVGKVLEAAAGCAEGVVELIVRIVHLIDTEHSLQTTLIEWLVVSNKW